MVTHVNGHRRSIELIGIIFIQKWLDFSPTQPTNFGRFS